LVARKTQRRGGSKGSEGEERSRNGDGASLREKKGRKEKDEEKMKARQGRYVETRRSENVSCFLVPLINRRKRKGKTPAD